MPMNTYELLDLRKLINHFFMTIGEPEFYLKLIRSSQGIDKRSYYTSDEALLLLQDSLDATKVSNGIAVVSFAFPSSDSVKFIVLKIMKHDNNTLHCAREESTFSINDLEGTEKELLVEMLKRMST